MVGLRILTDLRRRLNAVKPLAMESLTFERHRLHAQPLSQPERDSLLSLSALDLLADCSPLLDALLASG